MNRYNDIITDRELRSMLNNVLLEDDLYNEHITDMEAKIIFTAEPLLWPSAQKEQEMLKKLNRRLGFRSQLKWLLAGLGFTAVAVFSVLASGDSPVPKSVAPLSPQERPAAKDSVFKKDTKLRENDQQYKTDSVVVPDIVPQFVVPALPALVNEEKFIPGFSMTAPEQNKPEKMSSPFQNFSQSGNDVSFDTLFKGITSLEVNATACDIVLDAQKGEDLTVKGTLKQEKRGIVRHAPDYRFFYERSGTHLKVWIENMEKKSMVIIGSYTVKGSLNFVVPEKTDIQLHNSSGNIQVKGVGGSVCQIKTSYGHITVANLGTSAILQASSGNIQVSGVKGNVQAESSYGNLDFKDITGDLNAKTSSGNIHLDKAEGSVVLSTSYGHIQTDHVQGNMNLNSVSGNISAKHIVSVNTKIKAGYGHVVIDQLNGDVEIASRSGDVNMNQVRGNVNIDAGYGHQVLIGIEGDIQSKSGSGNISVKNSKGNIDLYLGYGNTNLTHCTGDIKILSRSGNIQGSEIELLNMMDVKSNYGNVNMQMQNPVSDMTFDLSSTHGQVRVNKDGLSKEASNGALKTGAGRIHITGSTASGNQLFH
jgi:DUF4097 and DUF4098 domain-containing protein YvlB